MSATIRVLVIDDHQLIGDTLKVTLSEQDGIDVVGVAPNGTEGIALARELIPDVVLVDYRLPDMTGADLIRRLGADLPSIRCVVLTGFGHDRALMESLEAGALGFVTKQQRFKEIVVTVRAAAAGEITVSPALLSRVIPQLRKGPDSTGRLTPREREVLSLMAIGKPNREIASELCLSVNTIRNHVAGVLTKLSARSRVEAVAIATREGLVSPGGTG